MNIDEQAVQAFMDSFWGEASEFVEPSHVKTALTAAAPYMQGSVREEAVKAALKVWYKAFDADEDDIIDMRDALTAAAPYMSGVKVKQLEWVEYDNERGTTVRWDAEASNFGVFYSVVTQYNGYRVVFDYLVVDSIGVLDNLEAAKAAAQADYEKRILNALEPSSEREQALEETINVKGLDTLKQNSE